MFIAEVGHSLDNIQQRVVDLDVEVYKLDSSELDDSFADDSQHA